MKLVFLCEPYACHLTNAICRKSRSLGRPVEQRPPNWSRPLRPPSRGVSVTGDVESVAGTMGTSVVRQEEHRVLVTWRLVRRHTTHTTSDRWENQLQNATATPSVGSRLVVDSGGISVRTVRTCHSDGWCNSDEAVAELSECVSVWFRAGVVPTHMVLLTRPAQITEAAFEQAACCAASIQRLPPVFRSALDELGVTQLQVGDPSVRYETP